MKDRLIPLSELKVGESATIIKNDTTGVARQRFMAMGLVTGEKISVKRIAPLGDPIDCVVKDYHLSLRKSEARDILVEPI